MIIKKKIAYWGRVEGAVAYHVRVTDVGVIADTKDLEFVKPQRIEQVDVSVPQIEFDIGSMDVPVVEGLHDVFISSVDKFGNEPDPLEFRGAEFDFTPPPPVTVGGFR